MDYTSLLTNLPGWYYCGLPSDFSDTDRDILDTVFKKYIPEYVDVAFDTWTVYWMDGLCYAGRNTWAVGISTNTVQELAERIETYYQKE